MTNPEAATVAPPRWEVLQTLAPVESEKAAVSQELAVTDATQAIATTGSPLRISTTQAIPSFREWEVNNGFVSADDDSMSIVSFETAVLDNITKATNRPRSTLLRIDEALRDEAAITLFSGTIGGMALGCAGAFILGGNQLDNPASIADTIAVLTGTAAGFFGTLHGVIGDKSPLYSLGANVQRRRDAKSDRKISALVSSSSETYAIPNVGTFTHGLGRDVVTLLRDAENPKDILAKKVTPIVTAIMQAEVDFTAIEPEMKEIEARTKELGTAIASDRRNLDEFTAKKKSLETFAGLSRKQLDELHINELRMKSFKEKLLELSPDKLELTPELREFCDGVADAVKASYEPKLAVSAQRAIDDLAGVIMTIDNPKVLQEIYEVFREKWAKNGINIPEYETFQVQIAQNREQR
jgi:hypothetical protein